MERRASRIRHFLTPRRAPASETTREIHSRRTPGGAGRESGHAPQAVSAEAITPTVVAAAPQAPERVAGGPQTPEQQAQAKAQGEQAPADAQTAVAVFQADAQPAVTPTVVKDGDAPVDGDTTRTRNSKRRRVTGAAALVLTASTVAACSAAPTFQTTPNTTQKTLDCSGSPLQSDQYPGTQQPTGKQIVFTVNADASHAAVILLPNDVEADASVGGKVTTKLAGSGLGPTTAIVMQGSGEVNLPAGGGKVLCVYPLTPKEPVRDTVTKLYPAATLMTVGS